MAPWLISGAIALAKEFIPSMVGKVAGDTSGKVASKVIDAAAELTGVPVTDGNSLGAVTDALRADPKLALQFQTRMAELELEETKAYLDDRADARERDVEMTKAGRINWRADAMVIVAFLAVTVICIFLILTNTVNPAVLTFLTTIGGMMMKNISTAFDFEFGSSRSSKGKSEDMGKLLQALGAGKGAQ